MSLTNVAKNTAVPSNQGFGNADMTWDDADFTWDEGGGTWDNPYKIANASKNTATLSNQAKSS